MAKPQKPENEFTTISVRKVDKQRLRGLAKFIKRTKNGDLYESDAVVFNRLIASVQVNDKPHDTYPTKKNTSSSSSTSQDDDQRG